MWDVLWSSLSSYLIFSSTLCLIRTSHNIWSWTENKKLPTFALSPPPVVAGQPDPSGGSACKWIRRSGRSQTDDVIRMRESDKFRHAQHLLRMTFPQQRRWSLERFRLIARHFLKPIACHVWQSLLLADSALVGVNLIPNLDGCSRAMQIINISFLFTKTASLL
jgi:hypothetical protein